MKTKFDFDEITLIPSYSIIESRSDCDASCHFGGFKFNLPIVPANMQSVIDQSLAIKLAENGYFYIMHRFDVDMVDFCKKITDLDLMLSISVGVNDDSYELIDSIVSKYDGIILAVSHSEYLNLIFDDLKTTEIIANDNELHIDPKFIPYILLYKKI